MKRFLVTFMILGLVLGSVATAESKKKPRRSERTVEGTYQAPALFLYGACDDSGGIGCVSFTTKPNERFLTAKVVDAHGLPVFVLVRNEVDGFPAQGAETYGTFCGETTQPIAVPPREDLQFWVGAAASPLLEGCYPGIGTSGTITTTFSNLP
ncbi:MAG: hypothetical protein M3345_06170 [Actinomycetota bacterium]|nr:hypothetical protein [Actinomycetota bacterium]